jgi:general secretion pathway protein I
VAILAVALAAGVRATSVATDAAAGARDRMLALWVAQNRIAAYSAGLPFPDLGERSGAEIQAGRTFIWHERIEGTPNPWFRSVEVRVTRDDPSGHALATLKGHVVRPR